MIDEYRVGVSLYRVSVTATPRWRWQLCALSAATAGSHHFGMLSDSTQVTIVRVLLDTAKQAKPAGTLLDSTDPILKLVGGLVTIAGFLWGLRTYHESVQTRRAEWLSKLHDTFFGNDRYGAIRRVLDYRPEPDYSRLVSAVLDGRHDALADGLYRYLNFFEFLAGLRELEQITDEEISGLFDYDLGLISQHEFILKALMPQGFEKLSALLLSRGVESTV